MTRLVATPDGRLMHPRDLRAKMLKRTTGRPQVESLKGQRGVYCKTKESLCKAQENADDMIWSICENCNRTTKKRDVDEGFWWERRADNARKRRWNALKDGNPATRRFRVT